MANDNHEKIKRRLKIAGFILLGIGIIFAIVGFVDFFSAFNGDGMPKLFWMCFIGLPTIGVGAGLLGFAYKQEISKYVKNESVPVINEAAEELTPAVKAVKKAWKDDSPQEILCKCGASNSADKKFCTKCGAPLAVNCPSCGAAAHSDDEFCGNCGKRLK